MSRLSIRARLAIVFSVALVAVVSLLAIFVYARVDAELREASRESLRSRLGDLRSLAASAQPGGPTLEPARPTDFEDNFSQILAPDGAVIASTLPASAGPAITAPQAAAASASDLWIEDVQIPGVDGPARVLAGPASGRRGDLVAVVGSAVQDQQETLSRVEGAFAIGIPLSLLVAAGAGLMLSSRAMGPVEAMRRRAEEIGGERVGERLPLPAAKDEIRALGETLNAMLDRLDEALAREQQFVADASHELRTPLSILKAELELADDQADDPAALRAALGSALTETDRLARLTDDLLVVARADRGRIPIHREMVRLEPLLAQVGGRFQRSLEAQGRDLVLDVPAGLSASIDRLRLEQAAGNLIDNAIRHGAGEIRVRAGAEGEAGAWIEVSDSGPGFPADFAEHAFERFSRPDAGRGGGGAGLGLAIVRALAEAHGGDATIAPGPGATVRLSFPADAA